MLCNRAAPLLATSVPNTLKYSKKSSIDLILYYQLFQLALAHLEEQV